MKKIYKPFFDNRLSHEEIYIRTQVYNRTMFSTLSHLSALLPQDFKLTEMDQDNILLRPAYTIDFDTYSIGNEEAAPGIGYF
jgi:hypothetical protein